MGIYGPRDNRGKRTFQVPLLHVALLEKHTPEGQVRFFLRGGPASFPKEDVVQHRRWHSSYEFSVVVPESEWLYGHPIRAVYNLGPFACFGTTVREVDLQHWNARKQDFLRSFCQHFEHFRGKPEMQDFPSVDRAGTLTRLAKSVSEATGWRIGNVKAGPGYGEIDPFDAVKEFLQSS